MDWYGNLIKLSDRAAHRRTLITEQWRNLENSRKEVLIQLTEISEPRNSKTGKEQSADCSDLDQEPEHESLILAQDERWRRA